MKILFWVCFEVQEMRYSYVRLGIFPGLAKNKEKYLLSLP